MSSRAPNGTQPRTRTSKAKGDSFYIFTDRTKAEIQALEGSQNVKDLPSAHQLLSKYGLKIPTTGISLQTISLALLEFTLTVPSLTTLQTDILRAIHTILDDVLHAREINRAPLAPSPEQELRLEDIITWQDAQIAQLASVVTAQYA